jgi:flagellar biosynthetic protein FliO
MDAGIMKAFLTLAGVVTLLALILYFLKKLTVKAKKIPGSPELKVLSKTNLGPKSGIYLVRVGSRTLLIGSTDHNINTLAELTPGVSQAAPSNQQSARALNTKAQPVPQGIPRDGKNMEDPFSFRNFLLSNFKKFN